MAERTVVLTGPKKDSVFASYDVNDAEESVAAGVMEAPLSVSLEEAFDYFNRKLWGGKLPPVVLVISRKKEENGGHYSPNRWRVRPEGEAGSEDKLKEAMGLAARGPNGWDVGELALNCQSWPTETDMWILSVLVHEMAHHWQEVTGETPKNGYHDKVWGREMKRVGLYPSNTSAPGGRETGRQMSHYVIEGGLFEGACAELLAGGFRVRWDSPRYTKKAKKSKWRYECPKCKARAWAKAGVKLICGVCEEGLVVEEGGEGDGEE